MVLLIQPFDMNKKPDIKYITVPKMFKMVEIIKSSFFYLSRYYIIVIACITEQFKCVKKIDI